MTCVQGLGFDFKTLNPDLNPKALTPDSMCSGCFNHIQKGIPISGGQLFGWELFMTFTLVSVVYATAVTKPGHGNIAPLAIGFTLFASAFVGTTNILSPPKSAYPAQHDHVASGVPIP